MSQFRSHVWLPGGVSACQLARNTGEIVRAGLQADDVPSCGPCLVAVSVLSRMAETMIEVKPSPEQTVLVATEELLRGPFREVGHVERIGSIMSGVASEFPDWVTVVLVPGPPAPGGADPDPTLTPPAAGGAGRPEKLDLSGGDVTAA